jgi:hypothetical protein
MLTAQRLKEYRKALVAFAGALGYIVNLGVLHGTAQSAVGAVLAALTAIGVYATPNGGNAPTVAATAVVPPVPTALPVAPAADAGHSEVEMILLVLTTVGVFLLLFGVTLR